MQTDRKRRCAIVPGRGCARAAAARAAVARAARRASARGALRVVLASSILCTALGCSTHPRAQQMTQARQASLAATASDFATSEARRGDRLPGDVAFIRSDLRRDARELRENSALISADFQRDALRWRTSQPRYRREAAAIFWAHPEQIEETAIRLFY